MPETPRPDACHCLCVTNHPKRPGVCTADADTAIAFDSSLTGRIDVTMCSACTAAMLAAKPEIAASELAKGLLSSIQKRGDR
jgi:hypothetical protein